MIYEKIYFSKNENVSLQTYILEPADSRIYGPQTDPRPAVIILAGGGYAMLSETEGEPAALTFIREGFLTFVLNYTVGEDCIYPTPLVEVSKAVWEVRRRADEWHIDPEAVALMGFSAGAAIAGMSATQWNTPGLYRMAGAPDAESIRPDAVVIGYGAGNVDCMPVNENIPLGKIGRDRDKHLNLTDYVGRHVPPVFIWHGRDDRIVPADQPLSLAMKLQKYGIPYELHVFSFGQHAMSVCNSLTRDKNKTETRYRNIELWVTMCANWLTEIFRR